MTHLHSNDCRSAPPAARLPPPRCLGEVQGGATGPTVVFVCGLHGDEPAGLAAARSALRVLQYVRGALRGRVVFLAGNRQALGLGTRFVRRDLNRGWTQRQLERLRRLPAHEVGDEDQEQLELADALRQLAQEQRGPLIVIDLHCSTMPSAPFVCFVDTLRNRRLAMALPMSAVLGLEEVIAGTLAGYCTARGHVGISVDSGHGTAPEAVARHMAAVILLIAASGGFPAGAVTSLHRLRARLARVSRGVPAVVEVRQHHVIAAADGFRMLPGLTSFKPVDAGQAVAHDASGPIRAREAGLLLMPRDDGRSEDGFFVVREVKPIWLWVSKWLRRMGAARLLPLLPGIRQDPALPRALRVDPRVALTCAAEVMHLCGYRRHPTSEARPMFSRTGLERY